MTVGADPDPTPAADGGDTVPDEAPREQQPVPTDPRVCVVIICFNDEERLGEAIRSAQEQSLSDIEIVVVDHGSTDDSVAVAQAAAEGDPRIRVLPLGDNEGKPGRPINAGIAAARAPWVTVFGSDDLLRPRACEHLLRAAEETGADLVVGSLQRVNMETGETTRWMPAVSLRNRVIEDLAQFPEIIRDTTGGGKLYNTEFVARHSLTFPEDIYYQDQVFTLEYYAAAARVAVISYFVLDWRHWPAGRPSVTQRRTTVENLADRFSANERIDSYLRREGRDDLLALKQRKFLQHDLSIHVKDLALATPEYREQLVSRTTAYTADFLPGAFVGLPLNKALMVNCLRAGRLADAEQVATTPYNRIASQWRRIEEAGRLYVVPPWHEATADPVFEVTRYRLPAVPQRFRSARAQIAWRATAKGFDLELVVSSPDKEVSRFRGSAEVCLLDGEQGKRCFVSLRRRRTPAGHARFTGSVTIAELDDAFGSDPASVSMIGQFHRGDVDQWSITLHPDDSAPVVAGPWAVTPGTDDVILSRDPAVPVAGRRRVADFIPGPDAATVLTMAEAREFLSETDIEPDPQRVFFESFAGRRIADGPLQVSAALRRRSRKVDQTWACNAWSLLDVPDYATAAPMLSRRYLTELARAKVWVDNGWLPFRPAGRHKLVQLWHGVPFVRLPERERRPRWSVVIASGEDFERWLDAPFPEGFTYQPFGAPRVAPLLDARAERRRRDLRRSWGLADRTVIYYSPILRDGEVATDYRQPDLQHMARALGDRFFWIHREHDDDATGRRVSSIPDDLRWFAATVSGRVEVSDYLLMADVLVTDYASVATDFGHVGRPVVHYVPDREFTETVSPGTNIHLADHSAGPVVADDDELATVLLAGPDNRSRRFAQRFAPWDSARSTAQLLDWLGF